MAKSKQQIQARDLRTAGFSIKAIAKRLEVSRGSVSVWCRDIKLKPEQIQKLHDSMVKGGYKGRLKGAYIQKERKQKKIQYYLKKARRDIISIKERELFIAGICLYWGEGNKKTSSVRFYNSDRLVVQFIMRWFREILQISEERFYMYVTINEVYKQNLEEVIRYWSKITNVPIRQFKKPILIKARNKKIYPSSSQYYGTLSIRIARSADLFYRITGWIRALSEAG